MLLEQNKRFLLVRYDAGYCVQALSHIGGYDLQGLQECVKALGVLASSLCPVQAQYLQQPFLGKVINYLKSRMKVTTLAPVPVCGT